MLLMLILAWTVYHIPELDVQSVQEYKAGSIDLQEVEIQKWVSTYNEAEEDKCENVDYYEVEDTDEHDYEAEKYKKHDCVEEDIAWTLEIRWTTMYVRRALQRCGFWPLHRWPPLVNRPKQSWQRWKAQQKYS